MEMFSPSWPRGENIETHARAKDEEKLIGLQKRAQCMFNMKAESLRGNQTLMVTEV